MQKRLADKIFGGLNMSSVVKFNESLERIERECAKIRLCLIKNAVSAAICAPWKAAIVEDYIAVYDASAREKWHFGVLAGYFDECWWAGIALFETADLAAATSDKLHTAHEILARSGVEMQLQCEHYVYAENALVCEDFGDFMSKVLEFWEQNSAMLRQINERV